MAIILSSPREGWRLLFLLREKDGEYHFFFEGYPFFFEGRMANILSVSREGWRLHFLFRGKDKILLMPPLPGLEKLKVQYA